MQNLDGCGQFETCHTHVGIFGFPVKAIFFLLARDLSSFKVRFYSIKISIKPFFEKYVIIFHASHLLQLSELAISTTISYFTLLQLIYNLFVIYQIYFYYHYFYYLFLIEQYFSVFIFCLYCNHVYNAFVI